MVPKPKGGDGDTAVPRRSDDASNKTPVPVAAAAESDSTPLPAQVPTADVAHDSWHPMGTAHQDGKKLWLADGKGGMCESVWRKTRQFKMEKNAYGKWMGKWVEGGYWSVMNFAGVKVPFKPVFWHE